MGLECVQEGVWCPEKRFASLGKDSSRTGCADYADKRDD